MQLDEGKPRHTEVHDTPTVASVATVASTSGDVEAAEPSHPDRPVGVDVDTASIGTEPGATEGVDYSASEGSASKDSEDPLAASTD